MIYMMRRQRKKFCLCFISITIISFFITFFHHQAIASSVDKITVKLERVYLDGEVSEEILEETILSMEQFWDFYKDWIVVEHNGTMIHLRKEIEDISPLLKLNGYFGISDDGFLNIYEGKPKEQKVIQSFFRIDTKKLKSHLQEELQEGIPVMSRENYQDILKMFQKYAL